MILLFLIFNEKITLINKFFVISLIRIIIYINLLHQNLVFYTKIERISSAICELNNLKEL